MLNGFWNKTINTSTNYLHSFRIFIYRILKIITKNENLESVRKEQHPCCSKKNTTLIKTGTRKRTRKRLFVTQSNK